MYKDFYSLLFDTTERLRSISVSSSETHNMRNCEMETTKRRLQNCDLRNGVCEMVTTKWRLQNGDSEMGTAK